MSTAEIFTAALSLRAKDRSALIMVLLESLEGEAAPFPNAKPAELARRLATSRRKPHSSVVARARAALAK